MNTKKLRGKDGELYITYKNVRFATAERFTAELIERTTFDNAQKLGTVVVGTGYKAFLRLNDVTVSDDISVKQIIDDMNNGTMPDLAFHGKYRCRNDMAERIVFRACELTGEIDIIGLAAGSVWDLDLVINDLTDDHIEKFMTHGN